MKGDFTKNTYARRKHYAGVLMQQGRVELDADWNEQNDIVAHREGTTTLDTIGASGAPIHDAGFAVVAALADLPAEDKARPENANPPAMSSPDLLVSGGRFYVGGELAENEHVCLLSDQPDLPKGLPRVQAPSRPRRAVTWPTSMSGRATSRRWKTAPCARSPWAARTPPPASRPWPR